MSYNIQCEFFGWKSALGMFKREETQRSVEQKLKQDKENVRMGCMEHIFLTLPKTFSSLDPFYQGHMRSLPNTTSQRRLTFLQFTCSPGSHNKNSPYRSRWRGKSGRKEAMRTWRGGGVHRKRLTSVLCVQSVATAVSGSAEHKSHQGELSGPAGKTQQREKISDFTKTLLHKPPHVQCLLSLG